MSSPHTPSSHDDPNRPGGQYVPARISTGAQLHLAGQTARRGENLLASGCVGRDVDLDVARACAVQCVDNLLAHAKQALGTLDRIASVIRLNVFVAATPEFADHSRIADAASDRIAQALGARAPHVRSAIGVASLPRQSPVEIDAIIELKPEIKPAGHD